MRIKEDEQYSHIEHGATDIDPLLPSDLFGGLLNQEISKEDLRLGHKSPRHKKTAKKSKFPLEKVEILDSSSISVT
jgi:hypothetical protein